MSSPFRLLAGVALAMLMATTPATLLAGEEGTSDGNGRAGIPFANLGGIQSWRPDGDRGIYVEGRRGTWYHAEFFAPCTSLLFTDRVAFLTDTGTSRLDRFSSILVDGERCHFRRFREVEAPGRRNDG
jgi:hypothetical protein